MAVGDVFKMALELTFTGNDQIVNTFHYRQELPVIGNAAEDLGNQWLTDVFPTYQLFLSNRIVLALITIRPVPPALETADITVGVSGLHGAGDIVPLSDSPIVSWRTGLVGRSRRGRVYLPPPQESVQDAGNLSLPYITLIDNWASINLQLLELGIPQWQQVVYSPTINISTPITAWIVNNNMGDQRRRRQGVGS